MYFNILFFLFCACKAGMMQHHPRRTWSAFLAATLIGGAWSMPPMPADKQDSPPTHLGETQLMPTCKPMHVRQSGIHRHHNGCECSPATTMLCTPRVMQMLYYCCCRSDTVGLTHGVATVDHACHVCPLLSSNLSSGASSNKQERPAGISCCVYVCAVAQCK